MALLVTLPAGINEKEVTEFLTAKFPGTIAEHMEDEDLSFDDENTTYEGDFSERDENGNFRELNLAIPGPPVSQEYWDWHVANAHFEAENNIDMVSREEFVNHLNLLTEGRLNLK